MSSILRDTLSTKINTNIKNHQKNIQVQRYIKTFIDKNSEVLYASGPNYRLFIDDDDRECIFKLTDIGSYEINQLLKKIDDIDEKWTIITPFNILSTLVIRQADKVKDEKLRNLIIIYLSLSLYSSLQFKYFKFLPNKAAMDYTINNMTNKFLIKKYSVLYKAIEHIALKNHEKYRSDLLRGNDLDIKNYIMNLRTRLNNFMKAITSEYLITVRDKKYLNTEKESRDEENYLETSNISLQLEKLINVANTKFVGSSINPKFCRVSANVCSVHGPTLENALKTLKNSDDKDVAELIRRILKIYFSNKHNTFESIKSRNFIPYCLQIYSKSNIKDDDVIQMKKLLDKFLLNYCNRYTDTEREATRISYRKATYIYFLLHIQACSMNMH